MRKMTLSRREAPKGDLPGRQSETLRMFIVTLVSRPSCLSSALVENLRNAWGGGTVRWLALGQAAEFILPKRACNHWDVWQNLQNDGVDMNVQQAENRRKNLLIADMDSTMIQQECIDVLADVAGVGPQVKQVTARAMNGELDFSEALTERVGLLKSLPETAIATVLETRITLMPGGPALLATMKANGAYAALVSGGFTAFTSVIAAQLGFDEHRANRLDVQNQKLTGAVIPPILGRAAKVEALEQICKRLGLTPKDVLAVGDGANDLGMLKLAGTGVALHAKPSVQAECDIRVNHGDLTALLFLQGYALSDFVVPA